MITRRMLIGLPLLFAGLAVSPSGAAGESILVLKTLGCGCCLGWVEHLEEAGFVVETRDLAMGGLMQEKLAAGLKPGLTSCHTGKIAGYVVEGHVPAREIQRLLAERPDAIGLTIPNMPVGSPGMEYGDKVDPYEVLLVRRDGKTEVYAKYS
jgi:hypothetical protein